MTTLELSLLLLTCIFFFLCICLFFGRLAHYHVLRKRTGKVIEVIEKVKEKKINFLLQKVHNVSKNNKGLTNLFSFWAIEAKGMRKNSAMATLHTRHLINLISLGEFKKANAYSLTLMESTSIFEEQWDQMVEDMNTLIQFAHHPISLITDQKQQYAEIDTIRKKIIGTKKTKTYVHLEKISQSVLKSFEEFERAWVNGSFNDSLVCVKKVRRKLHLYLEVLENMPIIVYLIGVVFKKEKEVFNQLLKKAQDEGLVMDKIMPLKRYNEYTHKIGSLNNSFLEERAEAGEIKDFIIDEIMKLIKLNRVLRIEIDCKKKYLRLNARAFDSYEKLVSVWDTTRKHEIFKFNNNSSLLELDKHFKALKLAHNEHKNLKEQTPMSLYSELLKSLETISGEIEFFQAKLFQVVDITIGFEKQRDIMRANNILFVRNLQSFYQIHNGSKWAHIRSYLQKQIREIKNSTDEFGKFVNSAKYNEFGIMIKKEQEIVETFEKLKWQVNNLEENEKNIRHLYEVANRYRSNSKSVNNNLDKVEIHISYHEIEEAYAIIRKILKNFDPKSLKKYPVRFK